MKRPKLYALLIGIDHYKRPLIPNLRGAKKDVDNLQTYLEKRYKADFDLKIKLLQDEAATRVDVIRGVEQHLGQAEAEDVVLFYFAGHGSWQLRNEAFQAFNRTKIEHTLVCHDSRTDKKYDLAELELLVLLNYVARNGAEITIFIDACHVRAMESRIGQTARFFEGVHDRRKLEHYLYDTTISENKFYYFKEFLKHKKIRSLPKPSYLSFYACDPSEQAQENEKGGWFTQSLLDSLKDNKKAKTYAQVYEAIRARMVEYPSKQTPILNPWNGFDVHQPFLKTAKATEKTKRFKVFKTEGKIEYTIQFGAQTGFPFDLKRPIVFDLFADETSREVKGTGEVQFIGMSSSPIHLSLPNRDYQDGYWAEVSEGLPTPMPIGFVGEAADLIQLQQGLAQQDIPQVSLVENTGEERFYIEWKAVEAIYRLYEKERVTFILEFDKGVIHEPARLQALIGTLEHLGQWQRTVSLSNPSSKLRTRDLVVTFETPQIDATEAVQCAYTKRDQRIVTSLKAANKFPQQPYTSIILDVSLGASYEYSVKVANPSSIDDYHLAVLLISADYGVIPLDFNIPLPAGATVDNIIDPAYGTLLMVQEQETQIKNYLKIIVSRSALPTNANFMLSALELEGALVEQLVAKTMPMERIKLLDWDVLDLEFHLVRGSEKIHDDHQSN